MSIQLKEVKEDDLTEIHQLQVSAFKSLLEKYHDFDTNPGAETLKRIEDRFNQSFTTYYFIRYENRNIGAIRIIQHEKDGEIRISPMFIHPDYQELKLGQKAVLELERRYPAVTTWSLDTIIQEEKLCHFYEKLGYIDTGKREKIKDGMDIIYYKKLKK